MKPWPWSRRWFNLRFKPGDLPEQTEAKIAQLQSAERITHLETSFGSDRPDDARAVHPTEDEAYDMYLDETQSAMMRTIAFFYAHHKHMNSGLSKTEFRSLGAFGDVDVVFLMRNPGYEGEGWRYRLTKLLRKWNLIEEFI